MSLSTPTTDGGRVESFIAVSSGVNVLHAQKYDAAGQKVGPELVLGSGVLGQYDVAGVAGGGYVLVYQSGGHGNWGEIRVQDASGATVASSSTAAGTDFHLVAGDGGGFLVSYHGTQLDHGLDGAQPLLQLYDASGHSLTPGHIELAGQIASIEARAGGVMAVNWNDGGTIRTLTLDPHTAASLTTPATPSVTVLDDVGAATGAVANGAVTDDTTPTFRIAVSQVGEVFVELDKDTGGAATYHNQGGGIAVIAADVARGYVDVTLPTSGDGHYLAWARVADASGSASYPVAVNFTVQAPAPTPGSGGQVMASHDADATLMGGSGDDTLAAVAGSNYLRGADGNDSMLGGSGFDDINGNKGDDTIDGGSGGGDWLVGGQGNDLIAAHTSGNILYGNLGNDTLIGGTGGDIIRGGQGDDSIVAGSGAEWISGDRGDDTIQAGSGADTFHTSAGAGIDRVLGFDAAKGDHVMIDAGAAYTVSQVGADTVIDLGHGDEMILVGVHTADLPTGWIL
jgi:Ca2+-binding RTX toxin-like protein